MENKEHDYDSVLKTPRRTRRTSVKDLQKTPSTSALVEVDESNDGSSLKRKDPVTPGRSARTLDFRTPSRSETIASAQTPRRSCRKSIKPIQEYENIVAQKGLSAKRLVADPTPREEIEEPAEIRENKWIPADIGRVSTKRSKKKRTKSKRLERQKNIIDQEEEQVHVEEEIAESDKKLNQIDMDDENKKDIADEEEVIKTEENNTAKEEETINLENFPAEEVPTPDTQSDEDNIQIENNIIHNEENNIQIEEKESNLESEENNIHIEENDIQIEDNNIRIEDNDIQIEENNMDESDDSMEGGDVILNSMPITGDDSPEKSLQQDLKTSFTLAPAAIDSVNKSDDSDCIMLSLNESSQSRQSICPVVIESKRDANESSDSLGNNMPTLLLCSDDEEDEEFVDAFKSPDVANCESEIGKEQCDSDDPEQLNGTFTAEEKQDEQIIDTVMCLEEEEEGCTNIEMCPEEIRKIVVGIEGKPQNTISLAPDVAQISTLNGTFEAVESPTKLFDTPKSQTTRPSITRILTPFKTDRQILPDIIVEPEEEFEEPIRVIIDPRDNKLKSSRKRSFSFCVDRPKKNVTFYSPANETIDFYQGDTTKSAKKHTPANITKRRKRSLSVTETERDLMDYIQMKKPTNGTTPQKKVVHQSKIKMPNFSNIHQKQFQRMESITDHVARRAERAKVLINSSTKVKPASVQKGLAVKNSVLRDHNKDGNKSHILMPKARQKIDMSDAENKTKSNVIGSLQTGIKSRSKSKHDLQLLDDLKLVNKIPTKVIAKNTTSMFKQNNTNKLQKPAFNFNFNSTMVATCQDTTVTSVPQRLHLPNPRENFNLSTTITTTRQAPATDKVEDRRKRMMEMFKSKSTHKTAENKREILKGVRTNRRFELQMMCRNRQN